MRELAASYRSLPLLTRIIVGGALVIAAIVLLVNVPNILTAILVVGLALLAIGLVLAFLGLCSLPFVGLGLALYGLVKALRPPAQPPGWAPAAPAVGQGSRSPRAAGRSELEPPAGLPAEIAAEEARLRDKAAALRSPGQSVFLTAEDQQHIDKTLNEYLPNCLATYQGLPSGSADWPAGPKGETASQLVERQLRLLEESLDRIGQRVFQAGAAQLVAQQRFLEERFRPPVQSDLQL